MNRFAIAVIAGWLMVGLARPENLKRRESVYLDKVGVDGGDLKADKKRGNSWLFRKTPQGVLIYLAPGERAGVWGGWYLNYDQRGKDPRVGLVMRIG